jgi:nucleoside-diphosphate-sugar epimerase
LLEKCALVTGHDGFIGRHLLKLLNTQSQPKVIFDGNVGSKTQVSKAFKVNSISKVYHLAGKSPSHNGKHIFDFGDYELNVRSLCNLVSACITYDASLIYPSSSAVYASCDSDLKEEYLLQPPGLYGRNKLVCERVLLDNLSNRCTVFRIANAYGPFSKRGDLVETLIRGVLNGRSLELKINPDSERDFVYVTDVVSAMVTGCMLHQVFNIGSGIAVRIRDLVEVMGQVLDRTVKVSFVKNTQRDRFVLDSSKLKCETGYSQTVSLEEGIRKTADWIIRSSLPEKSQERSF